MFTVGSGVNPEDPRCDPRDVAFGAGAGYEKKGMGATCNRYELASNQQEIGDAVDLIEDDLGNMEPLIEIYPDRAAPVVRNTRRGGN